MIKLEIAISRANYVTRVAETQSWMLRYDEATTRLIADDMCTKSAFWTVMHTSTRVGTNERSRILFDVTKNLSENW